MAQQTERWTYAGRRVGKGNKVLHCWVDTTGEELHYGKLKGASIGAGYDVEVDRSTDGLSVYGKAVYATHANAGDEAIAGWRARDAATQALLDGARIEKRAAADNELEQALDVLRGYHARLRAYGERQAFAQWVAAEVARPVRTTTRGE